MKKTSKQELSSEKSGGAKRNFIYSNDAITLLAFVMAFFFSAASLLSFFASAVEMKIQSSSGDVITTYGTAYSFIFGGKIVSEHIAYNFKGPDGLLLSSWILILLASADIAIALLLFPSKKISKETTACSCLFGAVLNIVASIILFSSKTELAKILCSLFTGSNSESVLNTIYGNIQLQFGIWGAAIFSIFSCLILIVTLAKNGMLENLFRAAVETMKKLFKNF